MYRSYFDRNCRSTCRSSYPNYAYNADRTRRNFGEFESLPYYNSYYYGRSRRRPYYWDRDCNVDRWTTNRRNRSSFDDTTSNDQNTKREVTPPQSPKPEPPPEELVKRLHVKDIDLCIKENTKKHRTSDYACTETREYEGNDLPAELVIRRGDSFQMTLTFDRPYSNKKNDLKLIFTIGKKTSASRGTKASVDIDETGNTKFTPDQWGATKISADGNDMTVLVHVPANCIVGEWNVAVRSIPEGKDENGKDKTLIFQYDHDQDITILFNPWCPDDTTYMATTELLDEYVLNETGCVYRGNAWTRGAKEWNFGQFEDGILEVALYLMRKGFKESNSRSMSDPIKVVRVLAKMVNSQDDNGVLVGNWSGDYDGGVSPSKWVGSVKILRQFMKSGPVKYGQCWVYSCLTTTVCRALGIPCRTVTNFASAHDTDESNSIEKYFIRKDGVLEKTSVYGSSDSVWNFHVWNEVWLERLDLNENGFNGWQVIDATPQEASDGVYTCGPCPVAAIKKGQCDVKFDTGFVFAEVNADEVHWEILPGGGEKLIELHKKKIGQNISTKVPDGKPYREAAGRWRRDLSEKKRLDVTHEYKFPEGSEEERNSVMMAHKTARFPKKGTYKIKEKVEPIEFHLEHSNEVMIGQDLPLELTAKNNGAHDREIKVVEFRVSPKTYTGETGKVFFRQKLGPQNLAKGDSTSFKVELKVDDYLPNLVEMASLYIEVTAVVEQVRDEPEQTTVKAHDFRFRRPDLDVESPEKCEKGEPVQFIVKLDNPLPVPLENCDISIESSGFNNINDEEVPDVPAHGKFEKVFSLFPRRTREHTVVFSFDCKTLKDITGSASVQVTL